MLAKQEAQMSLLKQAVEVRGQASAAGEGSGAGGGGGAPPVTPVRSQRGSVR